MSPAAGIMPARILKISGERVHIVPSSPVNDAHAALIGWITRGKPGMKVYCIVLT